MRFGVSDEDRDDEPKARSRRNPIDTTNVNEDWGGGLIPTFERTLAGQA